MTKIGRNDKCFCGSDKKYKNCCLEKAEEMKRQELEKYELGQSESCEDAQICMEYLREEYTDHRVIDITDLLSPENYRNFQVAHYTNKVLMVALRTQNNDAVFQQRGGESVDAMILYRGSYRSFNMNNLDQVTESIDKMIQTRLQGLEDKIKS